MKQPNRLKGQAGSALVVALLILVVLTIIGIAATTTTEIDIQMAGNDLFHKMAFYNTDGGIYATPKVISLSLDNGADPAIAGVTYLGAAGTFYRELMGFNAGDAARDVRLVIGGFNVDVDVQRTGVQYIAGGGTEFASGAEGVGVAGSGGGIAIMYDLDSRGNGPTGAVANIGADYRKVVGIPGGL
jgi:hypothetical protein